MSRGDSRAERKRRHFVDAMTVPAPVTLARSIAPLLAGLEWGIGGSVLMWSLGLEPAPRDLDVVTTAECFNGIRERIARQLGPPIDVPHSTYQSGCFARFAASGPVSLDLMADIRVRTAQEIIGWRFDPKSVTFRDGLPWMRPEDWVELYELFERPQRALALRRYLASRTSGSP
jgi:hypothetical protein